MAVAETNRCKS